MKKRIYCIILIISLALLTIACGEADKEKSAENLTETKVETKDLETESETKEDSEKEETTEVKIEENTTEEAEIEIEEDQTAISKEHSNLTVESEIVSFNMTTKMKTYYKDSNSRTEISITGMPSSILIHLADKEEMYYYSEDKSEGVKMTGAKSTYAQEMGLMMDTTMIEEIKKRAPEDMITRDEDLDGEKVLYFEFKETDEEVGEMQVKMWYSEKYLLPMKYEIIVGESALVSMKVTSISDNEKVDSSLFEIPQNVTFEEMDMKEMMEQNY